jgi:hypothetical protein
MYIKKVIKSKQVSKMYSLEVNAFSNSVDPFDKKFPRQKKKGAASQNSEI